MKFHTDYLTFRTKQHREYVNITPQVEGALAKSGIREGMILVSAMHITAGVWVGNDDKRISLGKKETGARAALPIWLEFMQQAVEAYPAQDFQNVVPLEKEAGAHQVKVDTPDTAPPADAAEQGLTQTQALPPAKTPVTPPSVAAPAAATAVVKPLEKILAPKPN